MHAIKEPVETVHVYIYREEADEQRRLLSPYARDSLYAILGLLVFIAGTLALCLATVTPIYAIQTLRIPMQRLPVARFMATSTITPTGIRTIPATRAHGTLTIYNGSILNQRLPAGLIVTTSNGAEIVTDLAVTVPPANSPRYGIAYVAAHAANPGSAGNIAAYAVNTVYGADVYIRNLTAFHSGAEAKTISYTTADDTNKALSSASAGLIQQQRQHQGLPVTPCREGMTTKALVLTVTWQCQFVTYTLSKGVAILSTQVFRAYVVIQIRAMVRQRPRVLLVR